jgi:hypothetical protein
MTKMREGGAGRSATVTRNGHKDFMPVSWSWFRRFVIFATDGRESISRAGHTPLQER